MIHPTLVTLAGDSAPGQVFAVLRRKMPADEYARMISGKGTAVDYEKWRSLYPEYMGIVGSAIAAVGAGVVGGIRAISKAVHRKRARKAKAKAQRRALAAHAAEVASVQQTTIQRQREANKATFTVALPIIAIVGAYLLLSRKG
jgi:hypothetical protein